MTWLTKLGAKVAKPIGDLATASPILLPDDGEHRYFSPHDMRHEVHDATIAFAQTHTERGVSPIARPVGWLFRSPPAGRRLPTTITVLAARGAEIWHRRLHGH